MRSAKRSEDGSVPEGARQPRGQKSAPSGLELTEKDSLRVLLVDDDATLRRSIRRLLRAMPGVEVEEAISVEDALAKLQSLRPQLVLIDLCLTQTPGDRSGLRLLSELREREPALPSVVVTSSREAADVRQAMKLGAKDYVFKDELCAELLHPIIEGFRERVVLRREVQALQDKVERLCEQGSLIGSSTAMERVRRLVMRLADVTQPVLLRGQTGTGKEAVARALHSMSSRRAEPFVAVNCAAFPSSLIEALLFGHEKGVFTGADVRRRGYFERAGAGTLLLDEIADMPIELQAKLLRVLEEGRFLPLGAEQELPLRARILAATHVDLERRIAEGRFRSDLYFRINVVSIELPPLSERGADLVELLQAFVAQTGRALRFGPEAIEWLGRRPWEGNVRELRNAVHRVALLAESDQVEPPELEALLGSSLQVGEGRALERLVDAVLSLPENVGSKQELVERLLVERALARSHGNQSEAARLLGIHRKALGRRWTRFRRDQPDSEHEVPDSSDRKT